ncbi:ubiquitin-like [Nematolebias whitei]|uniref:ubiquitin-like n=1 Tax=Nematolebias whitei TaxID=451745 RepID=UPI001897CA21|nr:ubiquitin-like [Nematolebias whitei]
MKNSELLSNYRVHHGSTICQAGRPCVQGAEEQEQKMENIKIFVKSLTGKQTEYNLSNTEEMQKMTVLQLMTLIYEKEGIPEAQQQLIFRGWQLKDSELLYEYGVEHETVVYMILTLSGGGEFRGSIEVLVDFLEPQAPKLSD